MHRVNRNISHEYEANVVLVPRAVTGKVILHFDNLLDGTEY